MLAAAVSRNIHLSFHSMEPNTMICHKFAALVATVTLGVFALGAATAQDHDKKPATRPAEESKSRVEVPFYGNAKCPVSGKDVNVAKSKVVAGQVVYFCCDKCVKSAGDNDKALVEKAYPADKVVDLKNDVCPVMGDRNGDSKDFAIIMGRKVHMCCDDCPEEAAKAPVATLAVAMNPKLVDVGNRKCPISEHDISKTDVVIYDGKVVRLCCGDCVEAFKKEPQKMLEAAQKSVKKVKKEGKKEHDEHDEHEGKEKKNH
jgi:YHS domain-containing protein